MRAKFLLTTISLVSATAIAYWFNFTPKSFANQHREHQHHNHHHHDHDKKIEIPENAPVPTVDLIVHPDSHQGWNLEIRVTNFRFAPENVNQESNYQEGHAHLYINGEKITRLYGNWYYLNPLPLETNEIKVSLNANGHEMLTYGGKPIEDLEIVSTKVDI